MRIPLSWLREYVEIDVSTADLAERLSVSSAEVKAIERRGVPDQDGNLGRFRVGRVLEAGKHPNADRLQVCLVDVGEGEPRQIVCGAWNFGAGATVAVALPGAILPGGQKLERARLRGAVSDGMILSERELELGPDHTGILVLSDGEPGTELARVLPLVDEVLELETTPNRVDLLSVYGIGREVAALLDVELAPDAFTACEALDCLPRAANLQIALRTALGGKLLARHRDARAGNGRKLISKLVANDLVSLQQIGKRSGHVAYLVADRLGEPALEPGVQRHVAALLDFDGLRQQGRAQGPFLSQAQEPIHADLAVERKGGQRIGAWQALVSGRQKLRQGGPVETYASGQGDLGQPGTRHGLAEPLTKDLEEVAPVHYPSLCSAMSH
jgi:tRNA-binding EMAP/Myf-like protein